MSASMSVPLFVQDHFGAGAFQEYEVLSPGCQYCEVVKMRQRMHEG